MNLPLVAGAKLPSESFAIQLHGGHIEHAGTPEAESMTCSAPAFHSRLGGQRAAIVADLESRLLVGRIGRPEEAAAAVVFMMETGYVTGSCLTIDGGGSLA